MAKVLLVDDTKIACDIASRILGKDETLEIVTAGDGAAALAVMETDLPDLVVTDLVMPNMDGLELVANVRKRYPLVPVIIMTSHGNELVAVKALQAGAASYVPKDVLATNLLDTVLRVLGVSEIQRDRAELLQSMTEWKATFVLDSTGTLITVLVKHLQETMSTMGICDESSVMQVSVALQEALINATHHGNLEVGSEMREDDVTKHAELLRARKKQAPYKDRCITVNATISRTEARFHICDEGNGFDVENLPDPRDPKNLMKAHGRGVLLMRSFMDECKFNDVGNEVTLVKRTTGS